MDCTAVHHHSMLAAEKEVAMQLVLLQRAQQKRPSAEDGELDSFEDERGIRALRRPAPRHQNGGDLARRSSPAGRERAKPL